MLFDKSFSDLNFNDVKEFCRRYDEGWRVEYKQSLDDARKKIPIVISSFANTNGGVLILGVDAPKGKPTIPIKGFPKSREEIRLSIQKLCLDNIYPGLFPDVIEIPTEEPNHIVVVVKIEESAEAPHAIENSEKVYLRTGDGNTPYKLSDIDTVERLFQRRNKPLAMKEKFQNDAAERFKTNVGFASEHRPFLMLSLCPILPKEPIIGLNEMHDIVTKKTPSYPGIGTPIFTHYQWSRANNAIYRLNVNYYFQVNNYGHICLFYLPILDTTFEKSNDRTAPKHLFLMTVLEVVALILNFSRFFFNHTLYQGSVELNLSVYNARGLSVLNERGSDEAVPLNKTLDNYINISDQFHLERLSTLQEICSDILSKFFWPFNRQEENITKENFLPFVNEKLRSLNLHSQ